MLSTNIVLGILGCDLGEEVRIVYNNGKEILIKVVNNGIMVKSGGGYHQSLKVESDLLNGLCKRKE